MINIISFSVFAVTIIALIGRFLAEPPAGWPSRELSISSPPPLHSVVSAIKSNPVAYAQAKSVETLTKSVTAANSDKTILNFNDGSSPFGLKKNAEIWNGRIAMVRWKELQVFALKRGGLLLTQILTHRYISLETFSDCFYLGFRTRIFSTRRLYFCDAKIGRDCHDIFLVCDDRYVGLYGCIIFHGRR